MSTLFMRGGIYMWPLLLFAIIIVALSIKKIIDLFFKTDLNQLQLESGVNSILFWGGLSLLLGFLGHYHGMYLAMREISRASDISPAIVAMGYGVSLITVMFGLLNLFFAAIVWSALRWRLKQLTAKMD